MATSALKIPADPTARIVAMRLESIARVFDSDAEVAEALGVNRSQPGRWRVGQRPDAENADRIVGLDAVIEMLSGYLSPSSIRKWLNGTNAHLGDRRPIAVLRSGMLSDVIAAIEAEKSGAYA
jgi:hypothetical protein